MAGGDLMAIDRKTLQKLIRAVEEFRKFDPEMPVQTVLSFLYTASLADKPDGVSIKDIGVALGVSSAAASRNISKLTEFGVKSQGGHGLLTTEEDPMFRVRKRIALTQKGKRVLNTLMEIVE